MSYVVMLVPVTGGWDPGAHIMDRQEKNDNLNLALAVGNILEQKGIPVIYTAPAMCIRRLLRRRRWPIARMRIFFVSFHRNAMPVPGTASGIESLV